MAGASEFLANCSQGTGLVSVRLLAEESCYRSTEGMVVRSPGRSPLGKICRQPAGGVGLPFARVVAGSAANVRLPTRGSHDCETGARSAEWDCLLQSQQLADRAKAGFTFLF